MWQSPIICIWRLLVPPWHRYGRQAIYRLYCLRLYLHVCKQFWKDWTVTDICEQCYTHRRIEWIKSWLDTLLKCFKDLFSTRIASWYFVVWRSSPLVNGRNTHCICYWHWDWPNSMKGHYSPLTSCKASSSPKKTQHEHFLRDFCLKIHREDFVVGLILGR